MTEEDIDEAVANYPSSARFNAAEKLALRYSELMALDPDRIDSGFYAAGKRYHSEAQIMELGAFIAFHCGMQVFMRTLGAPRLKPSTDIS